MAVTFMDMAAQRLAASLVSLALCAGAAGQVEKLKVGDGAPGLEVENWVEGEPLTIAPEGVYIVMFWESKTSSGHADPDTFKGLTHLFRLAEVYGPLGLVVVIIVPDNAERMRDSIKQQRQGGTYRLAGDLRGSTQRAWVMQAGISELPVAFIVGKGRIMHIGQPRDAGFEEILGKVVSRRYDPVLQKKAQPQLDAARRARKVKNYKMAEKAYDAVIAMDAQVFAPVALERFEMMVVDMDDKDGAYGYAREVLIGGLFANDAGALRMLAEKIVDLDRAEDLDVALAAAEKSLSIGGPHDPEALATAALVRFRRGERNEAIDLQTQAYFLARPEVKPQYKRVLDGYRAPSARAAEPAPPR